MGVGKPDDILGAIERGIDMFDCVHPTRAPDGTVTPIHGSGGVINLKNARHKDDHRPLDAESKNLNCRRFSRAYLHHLVKSEEILGANGPLPDQSELLSGTDVRRPCLL